MTPSGRNEADAIIAGQDTSPIPPEFRLQTCIKGNWILLSKTPEPNLCTWIRPPGPPPHRLGVADRIPVPGQSQTLHRAGPPAAAPSPVAP